MEKIIFFSLALPALAFVIYLGGSAIMKGFAAKVSNRPEKNEEENFENIREMENISKTCANDGDFLRRKM